LALWPDITPQNCKLFVVDCQEKLMPKIWRSNDVVAKIKMLIKGFTLLDVPVSYSEQYPKGLGHTVAELLQELPKTCFEKTHFSCLQDMQIEQYVKASDNELWVLVGIEAHICLLQTAKDLVRLDKKVIVAVDATSSRSQDDYLTALSELKEIEVRLTSTETLLFELLRDAKHPLFKQVSLLVK